MRTSATRHLVVYGTLRRAVGHPRHAILAQLCEFIDRVTFRGRLYDLGAYPGVQLVPGIRDLVHGELYRLRATDEALAELDFYESYDPEDPGASLFCRTTVDVFRAGVPAQRAWVYRYNRSVAGSPRIASGDYLQFLEARKDRSSRSG